MRKTLILMLLVLTASPLAACKMFWEHDDKPAAVATEPTATDPTATAGTTTSPDQTASMSADKPAAETGDKTETSAVPAKK